MIEKILQKFFSINEIDPILIDNIIYSEIINEELGGSESILIKALAESFKDGKLILREGKKTIRTPHKLRQCMQAEELEPLLLPLLEKIEN